MTDLTDAEIEEIRERASQDFYVVTQAQSDVRKLLRALEEARAERDG